MTNTTYATICFPDYPTAKAAAQQLGFWDTDLDKLKTDGQTIREDGTAFSWCIDEIGEVPDQTGYFINATGELPEMVTPFLVPYGSAGRVFAGTSPQE